MDMEKKPGEKPIELNFTALSDGLGFHPFSDGLPYAPISKTPTSQAYTGGMGANAAGAPRFAPELPRINFSPNPAPSAPSPRVSVPVAPYVPATPAPHAQTAAKIAAQIKAQPGLSIEVEPDPALEPRYGFGYVFLRLFAYVTDTALNLAILLGLLSLSLSRLDIDYRMLLNADVLFLSLLFLSVLNWALVTAQEIAFGTSVGKRLFGLALDGSASAIFLRAFFFVPSMGFLGFGLIWSVFDRKKRCWHDMAADLQPIQIARL